jgi:hypothetical protein
MRCVSPHIHLTVALSWHLNLNTWQLCHVVSTQQQQHILLMFESLSLLSFIIITITIIINIIIIIMGMS